MLLAASIGLAASSVGVTASLFAQSPPLSPAPLTPPNRTQPSPVTPAPAAPALPSLPLPTPATIPADAAPQAGVGESEAEDARIAVAQRMAQAAYEIVQADVTARDAAAWQQSIAFLEAARRLDPKEQRYPRLQAEAYSQLGDFDGAATSLEAYLALRGDDDTARLKLIEYYVAKMQTTDAKLKYLTSLLDKPSISNELKSRCATFAAVILGERSVRLQVEMTDRALALDPLNIYARRLEYAQLLSAGAGPEYRVKSLFALLRCNPSQVHVLEGIGHELAAAGLTREALDWMASAKNLSIYLAQPDPNFFVEYASQLYINGLLKDAEDGVGIVLQADPRNIDAWFLLLTLRRSAGLQVAFDQDLDRAKVVLESRMGALASKLESEASVATTRPAAAGVEEPNFAGAFAPSRGPGANIAADGRVESAPTGQRLADTITRVKKANPDVRADFISAVTDLAWFEVYFNRSATASRNWITTLSDLVPAEDLALVRLRGWFEILENRQAEAMKTLWSIRDRDALAAMGVSRLLGQGNWTSAAGKPATRPASQDPIITAQNLINRFPNGLLGAMLIAEFKDRKLSAQPQPYGAELKKIAATFPLELLQIIIQPDKFYVPVGTATKLPYRLGEPLLANVAIRNLSDFDLPVGPEGIIKPDLWFDTRVSLGEERVYPMSGYDKIVGPLVLKRRGSTSQVVRMDQGKMTEELRERPAASVNIFVTVMTNPMVRPDFRVAPGPSGMRRQFSRSLIRGGMPIFNEPQRKKLLEGLKGLPNEKMWTLEVLAAIVQQSRGLDSEPTVQRAAPEFLEQIRLAQNDRVPQVAAFASFTLMKLLEPEKTAEKARLVSAMATSSAWEGRMAAIWAARDLPADERKKIVGPLTSDTEELVKAAATADMKLAAVAATRPASQPATKPAPATGPSEGPALPPGTGTPSLPLPGQ